VIRGGDFGLGEKTLGRTVFLLPEKKPLKLNGRIESRYYFLRLFRRSSDEP